MRENLRCFGIAAVIGMATLFMHTSAKADVRGGIITCSDGSRVRLTEVRAKVNGSGEIMHDIYSFKFVYDDNDKLINVYSSYLHDGNYNDEDSWNITYNPFVMKENYSPATSSQGECTTYTPTLNERGAFISVIGKRDMWYKNETEWSEGLAKATYDKDNCRLTFETTDKGSSGYEAKTKGENIWNEGKILSSLTSVTEIEDGYGSETYTDEYSYSYTSDIYANNTRETPQGFFLGTGEVEFLYFLGFWGNGPKYLPTHMTYKSSFDEHYDLDCSYTFNSNGTIATSTLSGAGFNLTTTYSYEKAATQTGIEHITVSDNTKTEMFDATGMKHNRLCKGLNILRKSDGSCIKVMRE